MEQQKYDDYKELNVRYLYNNEQPSKGKGDRFMETMKRLLDENDDVFKRLADK
jgi:hypothetical protein